MPAAWSRARNAAAKLVVDAPSLDDRLNLLQALEHLAVQAFVPDLCSVVRASLQAVAMVLRRPCDTPICGGFVTIYSAANLFRGMFLLLPGPCSIILSGAEKRVQVSLDWLKRLILIDF